MGGEKKKEVTAKIRGEAPTHTHQRIQDAPRMEMYITFG